MPSAEGRPHLGACHSWSGVFPLSEYKSAVDGMRLSGHLHCCRKRAIRAASSPGLPVVATRTNRQRISLPGLDVGAEPGEPYGLVQIAFSKCQAGQSTLHEPAEIDSVHLPIETTRQR